MKFIKWKEVLKLSLKLWMHISNRYFSPVIKKIKTIARKKPKTQNSNFNFEPDPSSNKITTLDGLSTCKFL